MYHFGPPDPVTGTSQSFALPHDAQANPYGNRLKAGSHMYGHRQQPTPNSMLGQPNTHTLYPMVTGTSVLGMVYADGVLLATDNLGSYGSLGMFKNFPRLHKVNETTAVGFGGDLSDMQHMQHLLQNLVNEDEAANDNHHFRPSEVHSYLSRVQYNRRSKFDPLWASVLVAGFHDGKGFLGYSDLVGTSLKDDYFATGMGSYLAIPLLRSEHRADMSYEEAKQLFIKCLRILFYRDCRASDTVNVARVDANGVKIEGPITIDGDWEIARDVTH